MRYKYVRFPLRVEDADSLCNACRTVEDKLLVWTLLDTGLRIGELCSLESHRIMWQQKAINVIGKGNVERIVPMTRRIQALLENYFTLHDKWFISVRVAQKRIKEIANRAKIKAPVTCHVLRHTFATFALQRGVNIAAVSKILGHSDIRMTMVYLNMTPEMICQEFNQKW